MQNFRVWLGGGLGLAALAAFGLGGFAHATDPAQLGGVSGTMIAEAGIPASAPFKKVMIIMLENEDADNALSKPYLKEFAAKGAYFDNYYAIRHPSQPNYIAMISGSTQGVDSDDNVSVVAQHIGDLLETHGLDWKNYAEGYPGGCDQSARIGKYARKHVPFMSFNNIQVDDERCAQHIVPAENLDKDIAAGTLPAFSIYTPDLDNDGHDTSVEYADQWLKSRFDPLLADPRFSDDMLLIVTFDEGSYLSPNRVYTAFVGPGVKPGQVINAKYNHYNLLRTIEDAYGLGDLGFNDHDAAPITGIWARH